MRLLAAMFVFVAIGLMLGGAVTMGIVVLLSAVTLDLCIDGWDA